MFQFYTKPRFFLKDNPDINEQMIQSFIFDNPSVLGIGDLESVKREKKTTNGGYVDMILSDSDNSIRYEVEIQLGATDSSHIIRTIEYWDLERKRYPQYNHCAVIIAESITNRFMNVISLFNGAIPLIAIQMSAYKDENGNVQLIFTKVLDRMAYVQDIDEHEEVKDRSYWENKTSSKVIKVVNNFYDTFKVLFPKYELKYNKYYIGLTANGISRNFIYFKPRKSFFYFFSKMDIDENISVQLENNGIDFTYNERERAYMVTIKEDSDYKNKQDVFEKMIKESMFFYKIETDEAFD